MTISYAQNQEDIWLNRVFADKAEGFYIDVGAHMPETDSVTKLFYNRGWHGINLEPIPELHALFLKERPRDINLKMAAGAENGILNLYTPPSGQQGFATLDPHTAELVRAAQIDNSTLLPVQVSTLADICWEHAPETIDFLKIDVAGFEKNVILGMNFKEFRPTVLVVEAVQPWKLIQDPVLQAAHGTWHDWEPLLMDAGYVFATFDGLSRYYVRKEDQHLVAKFIIPVSPIVDGYRRNEEQRVAVESRSNNLYILKHKELQNSVTFFVSDDNVERDAIAQGIKGQDATWLDEAVMALNFADKEGAFIDIGANLGLWSFTFASEGFEVYGFEGASLNHAQLLKSTKENRFNCNFLCAAIVEKTGIYKFISEGPYGHLANNFIDLPGEPIFGISIDDWFNMNSFPDNVSFIKMDIEGGEIAAFKGMQAFLAAKKYPPIFIESNAWTLAWSGKLPQDLISTIEKEGYETFVIKDKNTLAKVSCPIQALVVHNYLFVHPTSKLLKEKNIVQDNLNEENLFYEYALAAVKDRQSPAHEHCSYAYAYGILRQKTLQKNHIFLNNFIEEYKFCHDAYNSKMLSNLLNLLK